MKVGTAETRLVLLRGNSASGKSSIASGIRARFGRGLALVGQDNLRRTVLREHDRPGAANIGLIDAVARYSLDAGYHVVLEGILYADHYGPMLQRLCADHLGRTHCYYLDVDIDETLRRHATKPQASEYGEVELRGWYRSRDLLPDGMESVIGGAESVIGAAGSLAGTTDRIMTETGLAGLPPLEH